MIDKKTFWLGVMLVCGVVLLAAHAVIPGLTAAPALARETVDSRDYQMATAEAANGGQVLWVLDKRSGNVALVVWNNNARRPEATDIKPLSPVFGVR